MITLFIIMMILAVFFIAFSGVAVILLDPLIAILCIVGVCKICKKIWSGKKK